MRPTRFAVAMLLAIADSAIAARISVLWSEFGGRVLLAVATAGLALFAGLLIWLGLMLAIIPTRISPG